jgi:hypothetical protein
VGDAFLWNAEEGTRLLGAGLSMIAVKGGNF